jgi:hypothetical protein
MIAYGVTPEAVSQILSQTNFITSNGYLADNRFFIFNLDGCSDYFKIRFRKFSNYK